MKIAVIILNIVLVLFTLMVSLTDGTPTQTSYIIFSIFLFLVPLLNVVVIYRLGMRYGWLGFKAKQTAFNGQDNVNRISSNDSILKIAPIICNVILLGFTIWALIDQYPHPSEPGLVEYELVVLFTPILSAVVIWLSKTGGGPQGFQIKGAV
jgi:hypothetical protein